MSCSLRSAQRGVAYLALMMAIAVLGMAAVYTVRVGKSMSQHDAEEELLAVGLQFQRALQSYANATPAGLARTPTTLDDLLRDPRHPGLVRHLRQIPSDPLTGRPDWVPVLDPQRRIVGLHSASKLKPLKSAGFARELAALEGEKSSYVEWVFLGSP
jgi:type II secretory pathway pseudopilin PulG